MAVNRHLNDEFESPVMFGNRGAASDTWYAERL